MNKVRKLSDNSDKKVDEKINNCTSLEKIESKKSINLGREEIREAIKVKKERKKEEENLSSSKEKELKRCGAKQSGQLGSSSQALDGILGFGRANSSMISQLASVGKVKKMFAHCLDGTNGGGIFAIGQLVEPKQTQLRWSQTSI
ncbi:Aspartic proteinase-like protein 2 [Camellia lanceoleosa]|uniref:Aspartic proteinase-like protein 2 n=1 Tax=Camellia lanceoleosa TaxID=1840588 RepID=A0ACC0HM42_9ERIC|nr:Aspartic proteinase-like protein 2 [Camellia lanceoleosa]